MSIKSIQCFLSYLSGFMTLPSARLAFTPRRFRLKGITRPKRNMSKKQKTSISLYLVHDAWYMMLQLDGTCIPAAYYLWTILRGIWRGVQRDHLLQRGSMKIPRGLLGNLAASVQHPGDEWRMRRMEKISFQWEAEAACIWSNRKRGLKIFEFTAYALRGILFPADSGNGAMVWTIIGSQLTTASCSKALSGPKSQAFLSYEQKMSQVTEADPFWCICALLLQQPVAFQGCTLFLKGQLLLLSSSAKMHLWCTY